MRSCRLIFLNLWCKQRNVFLQLMDCEIPAGISVADLAVAIADDVENKAHLFERFTVAAV